ncbi:hypothetical protein [Nocardia sp. NPDC051463]|uniref:hypothetical protein n=1 Tax=Nocardia sp. NPDC051463 TaxID=3154845 RepID=UPI00343ABB07
MLGAIATRTVSVARDVGERERHRVGIARAEIDEAVVHVEFSPPGARELELARAESSRPPAAPACGANRDREGSGATHPHTEIRAPPKPDTCPTAALYDRAVRSRNATDAARSIIAEVPMAAM